MNKKDNFKHERSIVEVIRRINKKTLALEEALKCIDIELFHDELDQLLSIISDMLSEKGVILFEYEEHELTHGETAFDDIIKSGKENATYISNMSDEEFERFINTNF